MASVKNNKSSFSVKCCFCFASVNFEERRYHQHLELDHNIRYEIDDVILSTLHDQNPEEHMKYLNGQKFEVSCQVDLAKKELLWNQCQYFCPLCSAKYSTYQVYRKHIKRVHKKTLAQVKESGKNKIHFHSCHICKQSIRFEYSLIASHMKRKHQVTLKEYEDQFAMCQEKIIESRRGFKTSSKKEWSHWDQCQYQCPECSETYSKYASYCSHVLGAHQKQRTELRPSEKSLIRYHNCLICHEQIRLEHVFMAAHVRQKHQISVKQYEDQFPMSHEKSCKKSESESSSWDRCIFHCPLCSAKYNSYDVYRKHIKRVHKKTLAQVKESDKNQIQHHPCRICKKSIRFENALIAQHMRAKHQMTLEEYQDQFEICQEKENVELRTFSKMSEKEISPWDQCKYQCPQCSDSYSKYSSYSTHVQRVHQKKMSELKPSDKSVIRYHKCLTCQEEVRMEYSAIAAHMKQKHKISVKEYEDEFPLSHEKSFEQIEKSKFSWDRCTYQCPLCTKSFGKYTTYCVHLTKRHGRSMGMVEPSEKNVIRYHHCLICDDKVRFDSRFLGRHMKRHHGMSLGDYNNRFKLDQQSCHYEMKA